MFDSADNGWKQYGARRFTVIDVPGDYLNTMSELNIGELGCAWTRCSRPPIPVMATGGRRHGGCAPIPGHEERRPGGVDSASVLDRVAYFRYAGVR